jgi:hypothetical protein
MIEKRENLLQIVLEHDDFIIHFQKQFVPIFFENLFQQEDGHFKNHLVKHLPKGLNLKIIHLEHIHSFH